MQNKKADSRWLSPWMFIIFGFVGIGIVAGVLIFYSNIADIRLENSKIISDKLINVVVSGGYLNTEILTNNFDILKKAGFDKDLFFDGDYYFNLSIYENSSLKKSFIQGTKDFEIQCRLNGDKFAKCIKREFVIFDKSKNKFKIKILTGSNNLGGYLKR